MPLVVISSIKSIFYRYTIKVSSSYIIELSLYLTTISDVVTQHQPRLGSVWTHDSEVCEEMTGPRTPRLAFIKSQGYLLTKQINPKKISRTGRNADPGCSVQRYLAVFVLAAVGLEIIERQQTVNSKLDSGSRCLLTGLMSLLTVFAGQYIQNITLTWLSDTESNNSGEVEWVSSVCPQLLKLHRIMSVCLFYWSLSPRPLP